MRKKIRNTLIDSLEMANKGYDFVGVSSSQLPYVHESFPQAGHNMGTVRYYTMRSMYRGRDSERKRNVSLQSSVRQDNKSLANVKLPGLELKVDHKIHRNYLDPTLHPSGNIYRQKAFLKLNGIAINQIYSVNRAKKNEVVPSHGESRLSYRSKRQGRNSVLSNSTGTSVATRTSFSTLRLDPITSSASAERKRSGPRPGTPNSEDSEDYDPAHRSRLDEMDRQSPITGMKPKSKKKGRKLGNIVSSRRLQQILDNNEETLDPGAFFYYWIYKYISKCFKFYIYDFKKSSNISQQYISLSWEQVSIWYQKKNQLSFCSSVSAARKKW